VKSRDGRPPQRNRRSLGPLPDIVPRFGHAINTDQVSVPTGMAPRLSRSRAISRSCCCRHALPNSTARKMFGSSCVRIGCRTGSSNPSTISSTTAVTPGTRSSISPGRSCPSRAAIGRAWVTQCEDWYYTAAVRESNWSCTARAAQRRVICLPPRAYVRPASVFPISSPHT
jgi:hypothetical protein